jgi:predicted ATPase
MSDSAGRGSERRFQGRLPDVWSHSTRGLRRAQGADDPTLLMFAHHHLGFATRQMGESLLAREHLEMAISLYDRERHRPLAFRTTGVDSEVMCSGSLAHTLWALGYPDQARKRVDEAVRLALGMSHPFSLGFIEFFVVVLHHLRGEAREAQEHVEDMIALSAEHGFTLLLAWATTLRGCAMAAQGHHEHGIAQIQEGFAATRATGSELGRPRDLSWLAEACMEAGRLDDGLNAVTEALTAADEHEIRNNEPDLWRLKGELLLKQNNSNSVEAQSCFEKAIEIARKQSAKSLELRATMSLTRLLAKEGRRNEAHAMLADIYNWFTEGFDTADLKDAKALLVELST